MVQRCHVSSLNSTRYLSKIHVVVVFFFLLLLLFFFFFFFFFFLSFFFSFFSYSFFNFLYNTRRPVSSSNATSKLEMS
jgi:hypothetical protein